MLTYCKINRTMKSASTGLVNKNQEPWTKRYRLHCIQTQYSFVVYYYNFHLILLLLSAHDDLCTVYINCQLPTYHNIFGLVISCSLPSFSSIFFQLHSFFYSTVSFATSFSLLLLCICAMCDMRCAMHVMNFFLHI